MKCPECQEEINLGMTSWEESKLEQQLEDYQVVMTCADCYQKTQEVIDSLK